jgi:hypothetical protein
LRIKLGWDLGAFLRMSSLCGQASPTAAPAEQLGLFDKKRTDG